MEAKKSLFAIKLYELEQEYSRMRNRLLFFQKEDRNNISSEIETMNRETKRTASVLQNAAENSRSPIAASFAKAQREYQKSMDRCLSQGLTAYKESSERADTLALYAEYAIDFAVLSMKHALLAAFSAIEMQMSAEETEQKNDKQP